MNLPADLANQALDAAGLDYTIGDLEEGTKPAKVLLRAYSQCLRQLLRAANWNFARKQAPLVLLADATGQTPDTPSQVIPPWVYEYQYPIDCMKARFVPWSPLGAQSAIPAGNILPRALSPQAQPPTLGGDYSLDFNADFGPPPLPPPPPPPPPPLMGGLGNSVAGAVIRPARWLEAVDVNYPVASDIPTWNVQGVSPQGRSVILTNVKNAQIVYTALMNHPSNWDAQFRAAFVAFLSSEIAFALWSAKGQAKFGMAVRDTQMKIAASKIMAARLTDGAEGWHNSDFEVDWMRTRNVGGGYRGGYSQGLGELGGGPGILYSGCDGCCGVGNTSAY